MSNIHFNKLNNAQNVEKIAKIFGKDKPNYELKPNPYLVVLVGSPGVGKTTKAKEFLKEKLKVDYNNFYNISLDSLVERVKPYRTMTKELHNTLKKKKSELGAPELNEKNFGLLSEAYLPTIMSTTSDFNIGSTLKSKLEKITLLGTDKKPKSVSKIKGDLKSLNDMRREGLIYGVKNGFNILYDTTFTKSKDKLKEDIMPILEMNKEVKYKIIVILVKADIKNIQTRIKGRHMEMLAEEDPYIRAINPTLTSMFVTDNKLGFDISKVYFKADKYIEEKPDTFYDKNDFTFIEVENPQKRNNTLKNNKNNTSFRYF